MPMKRIKWLHLVWLIITVMIIITMVLKHEQIQLYRYLKSDDFKNDQFLLSLAISEYELRFGEKPKNFTDFKTVFEGGISLDSPYQISRRFSKYPLYFDNSDTAFLIILSSDSTRISENLIRASEFSWYNVLSSWDGVIVSILPQSSFRCRDLREITFVKDRLPVPNKGMAARLRKGLKQYSLELIKEKQIQSSKFIFLKAQITFENVFIHTICDDQSFLDNNEDIFRNLRIIFDTIPELMEYDEVYFPLYLYPEIAPAGADL
jgi:hypothetical protein